MKKNIMILMVALFACASLMLFADEDIPKEASDEFIHYLSLRDSGNPTSVEVLSALKTKYPDNVFLQKEWLEVQYRYRRYDEALKVAEQILKMNPKDIDTLVKKADITERITKKFPEKQYLAILKIDHRHSYSLVRLAEYYISKEKWKKALALYYRIYSLTGDNVEVEHKLVVLNYKIKNYKGIYALHYKKKKNDQPSQLIWDLFLELVYADKNTQAVEQLIRSIQFVDDKPTRASLYYMLCMMKAREGMLTAYEEYLSKKKILPDGEWQFYIASYYLENALAEDDEKALPLLQRSLEIQHDNTDAMKYMVQYYIRVNNVQKIREWLLSYNKITGTTSLDITAVYLLAKKDTTVAAQFANSLQWQEYEEKLLIELVYTLYAEKKHALAYDIGVSIEEARFSDSGPYDFWYAMMQVSSSVNNETAMTRYFNKSIEIKPNDAYLMNYYAFSLLLMNIKINEAVAMLEKAYSLLPEDGAIMDSLGWGYFLQGKMEQANKLIDAALVKMSDDPEILYHKAKLLCQKGNKEEAVKYFKMAQEHDKEKRLEYANIEQDILDCTTGNNK